MKRKCLFTVLLSMVLIPFAKADLVKSPLCTATGVQEVPVMDQQTAVWSDARIGPTTYDIYGYSFSEPNHLQICSASGSQRYPAMSWPYIVWQDDHYSNLDIIGYDMTTRTEFDVCLDSASQTSPDVSVNDSGKVVVWQDYRRSNSDIYGYDLDADQEIEICIDTNSQFYPAVDYPWVVWADMRNGGFDIYAKNLQTGTEYPVCKAAGDQYVPDVSNGIAVWADNRSSSTGTDIYARVLPDGVEFPICIYSEKQTNPSIDGNIVAWEDERNTVDFDIYAYNLATMSITAVNTETGHQKQPSVCGSRILWQHQGVDLFFADMPMPTVLTVTSPDGGEMLLARSQTQILWQTEGPSPEFIKIYYSDDNGSIWHVIEEAAANTGAYAWTLPYIDSTACLVRIQDVADPLTEDRSDEVFTIFKCNSDLKADLDGDCLVDLTDFSMFAAQYLSCGNPYNPNWCFE